ncbi:chemotaxis protein CheW [Sinimarinibacterium sp. NLF-5-8]|uniref:chemotaxis protein CheW n=1 Tax=Sinimarinibacterium sp. NLF-5-8 TaxID=2698684 RepID=UPI00137B9D0F|nr:chemotaxis protein CheW [Sinimarinibacterium sp. NLF-5-8]QHS09507.1 hypothetical protein GT972_04600 [Sinimarinibacterium sp. NLF-5-8]
MTASLRSLHDRPFDLLRALERRLEAAHSDAAGSANTSWVGLGLRLAQTWLVVPRDEVREVIPPPPVTRVPTAQPWLRGVANVRGELCAIVDPALMLGLPEAPPQRLQRVLLLNSPHWPVGFLVDEVAGHRSFAPHDQRPQLAAQADPFTPWLLGAFVREGQPWLAFSLQRLVRDGAFRSAAL